MLLIVPDTFTIKTDVSTFHSNLYLLDFLLLQLNRNCRIYECSFILYLFHFCYSLFIMHAIYMQDLKRDSGTKENKQKIRT